jgi:inner membrane protein
MILFRYGVMDPVTHIASGVLGKGAFRGYYEGRNMTLFCVIAALLPDIDNLAVFFGPEFYLIHHRGATHSLAAGILLAFILAYIFRLFIKSFDIKKGFIAALTIIYLHLFLDLITSYGTQILFPFTNKRYSLESVFIVDPIYTFVLVIILIAAALSKKNKELIIITGAVWIFLYPLVNFGTKIYLEKNLEARLGARKEKLLKVHISPDVLTPFYWKVIIERERTYDFGWIRFLERRPPVFMGRYEKAEKEMFHEFGKDASIFNTYAWFAVYPFVERRESEERNIITFGDLRFSSTSGFVARMNKSGKPPFSLTAVLDKNGRFVEYYYQKPGGVKIIHQIE